MLSLARTILLGSTLGALTWPVACSTGDRGAPAGDRALGANTAALKGAVAAVDLERELDEAILYFFDAGCPDCVIVDEELLPRLLEAEGWPPDIVRRLDVVGPETVRELLRLEKALGFRADPLAPVLIVRGRAHAGLDAIRDAVAEAVERAAQASSRLLRSNRTETTISPSVSPSRDAPGGRRWPS